MRTPTMNATVISIRAARRTSVLVLGALSLAACDNDRALGPSSTVDAAPSIAANAAKLGTSVRRAAWDVRDMNGNLVGGSVFHWNDGTGPVAIADNSILDLNKVAGRFEVSTPS